MSDAEATAENPDDDEIAEIRDRKKEALKKQLQGADAPDDPVAVEDATHFAELTADGVVLVDFYADWCGPCKMLAPIVETLAAETDATVAKVDVDRHQDLAGQYDVQGVPTLLLFADGEAVERLVGVQEESRLRALIDDYS